MALRKIIYTRADGGVSVVHPVRNTFPEPETLTDAEIEQRAWDKLPADAITPTFVDASVIPVDRSLRRAWRQNVATIFVDSAVEAAAKDQDAIRAIDGTDRLQFEHLFEIENDIRRLRRNVNASAPGTYTAAESNAITKVQYRDALIAKWKTLHP